MPPQTALSLNGATEERHAVDKLRQAQALIREEYFHPNSYPWVIAFSGGKDSTLVLHLTLELLKQLPPKERSRPIHVVSNDTLVESPLVMDHLDATLEKIRKYAKREKLPLTIKKTTPYLDQTFWVNLIGRGYAPPSRWFRWCTDRMKIEPTSRYVLDQVSRSGQVIMALGVRKAESNNRKQSIEKREHQRPQISEHHSLKNCLVFTPITELTDNEVWMLLLQLRPLWGGTYRQLITLYKNAKGGECPLVLSKEDAPSCGTGSARFGCWTCTVVKKDRSLQGLVDSGETQYEGMLDFRDWLKEMGVNRSNRMKIRRNGEIKLDKDGNIVPGPFTLKSRQEILERLMNLQDTSSRELISKNELDYIKSIWRKDERTYEMLGWE